MSHSRRSAGAAAVAVSADGAHREAPVIETIGSDGPSLSSRTMDAFVCQLITVSSRLVLQIGVQAALARLLPLEAFGLLTVAMLVVSFGSVLSNIGTAPALIQGTTITDVHVRVAFSLSIVSGGLLTLAIWFCAPFAASVFKVGAVTPVLHVIGLVFVVSSVGATAEALLQRRMDYRRLLWVELISFACGYGAVGLILAMLQPGAKALAWATVAQATIKTFMLLLMSPHPVRPCFKRREARQLLNFGVGMTLSQLATLVAQNGDYFVVARWLGVAALGLYSRAYQLMCLPIYQFSGNLNLVLFPAYSRIQNESDRLRRAYLASLSLSAIVVFPVLTMFAIGAPEVMTGVFGPQWGPASVPLEILCVGGAGYCIYNLADSLVRAKGAVYEKFFYNTISALCVVSGASVGSRWGIAGVSVGVVAAIFVLYLLLARLSLRLTACTWRLFFRSQMPGLVISSAVAGFGVPVATMLRAADWPPLAVLAGAWTAAALAAIVAGVMLPRRWFDPAVLSAISMVKERGHEALTWAWRSCRPGWA